MNLKINRRQAAYINIIFKYLYVFIIALSGIILIPVYLRHFDMATYGAWLASANILGLIGIANLGLNTVYSQRLAAAMGKEDYDGFASLAGSGLLITFGCATVIGLTGIALSPWVPVWVNVPAKQVNPMIIGFSLSALGAAASLMYLAVGTIAQAWMRPVFTGLASTIGLIAGIVVTVLGLLSGMSVAALGAGIFIRGLTSAVLISFFVIWFWIKLKFPRICVRRNELVDLFKTTTPLLGSRIGILILSNCKLLLVNNLISPEAVAVLSLTGRLYEVCGTFLSHFDASISSGISHLSTNVKKERIIEVVKEISSVASIGGALCFIPVLVLNASFISLWVGPEKYGGFWLNLVLCLSFFITSRINFVAGILNALGVIVKTSLCHLAGQSIYLALMLPLLLWLGIIGEPLAAIISIIVLSVWLYSKFFSEYMSIDIKDGIKILGGGLPMFFLIFSILFAISFFIPSPDNWVQFIMQGGGIGIFTAVLILFFSPLARTRLREVYIHIKNFNIWHRIPGN